MNKVKFLVAALLGVLFTACSEEENLSQTGKTGFLVSLAEDVKVESRSTPEELGEPVASQFNLKITNQVTGSELYNDSYTSDLIPASAGTYAIEATHGENQLLAVDAPYYKGTAEAELADGESEAVNVECKVANALASVVFSDGGALKFEDQFSKCELNVLVAGNSALIDGVKSAYYRAGSTPTFEFRGTLKDSGEEVVQTLTNAKFEDPATFAAGAHCVITLKIGAVEPGVKIEITKVEVKEVTVSETIPMEWLPKPKVKATGFDSNNTLAFVETEQKQAALNLDLSSALQDIKFKFNFEDEQFASLEKEKEYLLSTDKETIEQALGITLPSIGDKPESIDLSGLIAKLQTNAGVPTNNSIEIDVQANNRWSSDAIEGESTPNLKYTLTCNKPEFSIAVQPGNVWTKTFTIDEPTITAGNAEILNEKLVYQYKERDAGDDAWQTCSGGLEQVFSDAPENKAYQVRAFYREGIVSDVVDITLETPAQLPNSDMEEWWIETKTAGSLITKKTYYTFHPYAEGQGNSSWWDTNNDKAQGGTVAFGIWYEGCFASCVSYTTDVHGGSKAALIYLSGCGDGYANTSGSYVGGAMVGSLFIGSYNSGIIQGHSFESRPSSLSFWYKYKPYNSDAFKVIVSLKDGDTEIATGTYEPTAYSEEDNAYKQATVDFNYTDDKATATTICVQFLASNKTELSGSDFAWGTTINYPTIGDWTVHMGSVLKIDDLHLNYDK